MSIKITSPSGLPSIGPLGPRGLASKMEKDGRLPGVKVLVKPLDLSKPTITLERFTGYSYSSSVLNPVDSFEFRFAATDLPPLREIMREGDISSLTGNDIAFSTGIIDKTEVETDYEFGETAVIAGRDLMGQLEDQDAISLNSDPIFMENIDVKTGVKKLLEGTRINTLELRDAPTARYLLASEPGERKLSTLQRFLEPLNVLAWTGPAGQMIVGKPNFAQDVKGTLKLSREQRSSNVLYMRATRNASQICNVMVPIWSGQELVVSRVAKKQGVYNNAEGPSRLRGLGHIVPRTYVTSIPNAESSQGASDVNALSVYGSNILEGLAKREVARENHRELIVSVLMPGHFNERGEPFVPDTTYFVEYDRGSVSEKMYLFEVQYLFDLDRGQRTVLNLCRLGTMVSDARAK